MSPHDALTALDIKLLFQAADGDGSVRIVYQAEGVSIEANGHSVPGVRPEGIERLQACGYLEGGPELFQVTPAGREYAESMK
jgi:hypothetical protein